MSEKRLSVMERDTIGEILNISLGSSATAVSNMLNTKVDITTPAVQVIERTEFAFDDIKPAVGVEITYVEGITGQNVMLLKKNDVRIIVEMLMGMPFDEATFELDEMNMSAICEVMNQMMGASATALSELLGKTVNISTPRSYEVTNENEFKEKYFTDDERMAVVRFTLKIGDRLESEFLNLMSIELVKELVRGFLPADVLDAEEPEAQPEAAAQSEAAQAATQPEVQPEAAQAAPQPEVQPEAAQAAAQPEVQPEAAQAAVQPEATQAATQPEMAQAAAPVMQQVPAQSIMQPAATVAAADPAVMEQMLKTMQLMQEQMMQMQSAQADKMIHTRKATGNVIKAGEPIESVDENLDLLMSVPLELSVEIGRTKKPVKEIVDLAKGSLVVLDRIAGEPIDLYVNGECIARGDVVVVEDNFGIRITEILQDNLNIEM